ncbi:MAG: CBS domain-containing protein [Defluviicoccus sp.]
MNVSDLMATEVSTVNRDASLVEASHRMLDCGVGFLPVVEDERLIGVITDRDLVVRGLAENVSPTGTPVYELMSIEIVCCFPGEDIEALKQRVLEHDVRWLPVIDSEHRLCGVVSRAQLGLADAPRKAPVKVTFQKTKTDGYGRQHKVPIKTVYITGAKETDTAVVKAIEHYEHEQSTAWTNVSDDLEVEEHGR